MVTMKHYWEVDIGVSESAKKLTSDDLDGVISRSRKSVCLSVTFVDCDQTAIGRVMISSQADRSAICLRKE